MKVFREPAVAKDQVMLLPPCVSDFVAQDEPVRLAGEIIDGMDLRELLGKYAGRGAPAYDPRMMMKVIVFGRQGDEDRQRESARVQCSGGCGQRAPDRGGGGGESR